MNSLYLSQNFYKVTKMIYLIILWDKKNFLKSVSTLDPLSYISPFLCNVSVYMLLLLLDTNFFQYFVQLNTHAVLSSTQLYVRLWHSVSLFLLSHHITKYVKRENIIIAWVEKNALVLMNVYVLYVSEYKTRKKNFRLPVCLSVCLFGYLAGTYVLELSL